MKVSFFAMPLALACALSATPCSAATLTVPETAQAPTIDGAPDEACWQSATAINEFRVLGSSEASPAATTCRLLRDDAYLYLGVTCESKDAPPQAERTGRDTTAVRDDSIEVFLGPASGGKTYFHFVLSAGGGFYEQKVDGRKRDRSWSTSWRKATQVDPDRWSAEIAIPLYVLGIGPLTRDPGFNICRNLCSPERKFTTWAPLGTGFHEPANFGELEGLKGLTVAPVADPRIRQCVADYYTVKDDRFFTHVRATIENAGGVAGYAVVELEDCLETGAKTVHTNRVMTPPVGRCDATWDIPITAIGARSARVRALAGNADWLTVQGTDALRPMSVFTDRNLYSDEKHAVVVCRAVFSREQAESLGYRYLVTLTDSRGKSVFSRTLNKPDREVRVKVPVKKLDPGVYRATVELLDQDGVRLATVETPLERRLPGPSTETKFDQVNEVILVNGEPFFPFGFMHCNDLADEQITKRLADAGFNTVVRWQNVVGGADFEKHMADVTQGLDIAHKHGIRVFEAALAFGPSLRYGMKDIAERFDKII